MIRKTKYISLFLSIILVMSLFAGCGNNGKDNQEEPSKDAKVADYFPIRENVHYIYEGLGNEYASFDVYNEYVSKERVQQRVDNGGTVMARVYEIKDGKVTRVISNGEMYYRVNLLNESNLDNEIILMEPLEVGTTWTLEDGRERTIANLEADVSTPMGEYKAIEVVTEGPKDITRDYYVKDIGLVKTVFTVEDVRDEVSSSLKAIEENKSRVQVIQFYFPNINDGKIYFKNKEVEFRTNDDTNQILTEAYKGAIVSELGEVFTTNTKINSMTLSDENKVHIDLNSAFQTEMNAGAAYETMILQSLANTVGNYFNAEEVVLTVEGKPYESGHIMMEEGQSIKVDLKNAIELDV